MSTIRCAECGKEHDLSGIEPSYRYPDAYLALPEAERESRVRHTRDYCILYPEEKGGAPRCFVRGVLHVTVHGEPGTIGWGLWAELRPAEFDRVWNLWDDPEQRREPPLACWIANHVRRYPETVGLPALLRLETPATRPTINLAPGLEHPFAREVSAGVDLPRSLEWRAWHLH
jgi:hypothetical protein